MARHGEGLARRAAAPPQRRGRHAVGRASVLAALAGLVEALDRPAVVGLDGGDAAGKTVLADELASLVTGAVRASLDDFHHSRAHRHALGRTAESVWARSYDLDAVCRELLDPWRRGAGAPYRRRWHDLDTDRLVDQAPERVSEGGVLLVDGLFLQRPELSGAWDLVVYVHADDAERVARMVARDGAPADPDHPDQRRYLDAQRAYRERHAPLERADVVVDNTDVRRPHLLGS